MSDYLSNEFKIVFLILFIAFMFETILKLVGLIFLNDIQSPSANVYRSIICILINYIEVNLEFAYIYKFFKLLTVQNSLGGQAKPVKDSYEILYYSLTKSFEMPASLLGKFVVCLQNGVSLFFVGVVMVYFINNFKGKKFK